MPRQKVRVLFLAANPAETTQLCLDEEARAIEAALRGGRERDSLDFKSAWAVRTSDLQQLILDYEPHVLHFSGHGSKSPGIMLGNEAGRAIAVDSDALAAVVRAAAPPIRVVVLNACSSLRVVRRFKNVVDYTIGMDSPITDASAAWFSTAFYGALAAGTTVEMAFEWGIVRLKTEGSGEADIPRLLKRAGPRTPPAPLVTPAPAPAPRPAASAGRSGTVISANGPVEQIITNNGDHATFRFDKR